MDIRPERPQDWRKVENLTVLWRLCIPYAADAADAADAGVAEFDGRSLDGGIRQVPFHWRRQYHPVICFHLARPDDSGRQERPLIFAKMLARQMAALR